MGAAPSRCVAVAYSGGRDSTALLHATLRAAMSLGVGVVALHVHHGLHADADAWLAHCKRTCKRWAARGAPLRLASARIHGPPPRGHSVEAWAREARYRALSAMACEHGASLVLLAQHRRDQAETFLLQALRGAGAAGLAAMPMRSERDGVVWARPWLAQPREAIEAYLRRHRLRFVDDASNADPRFARNRLRRAVWAALTSAFEQAEQALCDAARRTGDARALLEEVAAHDLAALAAEGVLDIAGWSRLTDARRANALLEWLRRRGIASATLVDRLRVELPGTRTARWPAEPGVELRAHRGMLTVATWAPPVDEPPAPMLLRVTRPGRYALPAWGGELQVRAVKAGGVELPLLAELRVRHRTGGEKFQAAPGSPPRSLKKQFQARGVPPWQRDGPLLFAGEQIVFAAGLGIDARALATTGKRQLSLHWHADPAR